MQLLGPHSDPLGHEFCQVQGLQRLAALVLGDLCIVIELALIVGHKIGNFRETSAKRSSIPSRAEANPQALSAFYGSHNNRLQNAPQSNILDERFEVRV